MVMSSKRKRNQKAGAAGERRIVDVLRKKGAVNVTINSNGDGQAVGHPDITFEYHMEGFAAECKTTTPYSRNGEGKFCVSSVNIRRNEVMAMKNISDTGDVQKIMIVEVRGDRGNRYYMVVSWEWIDEWYFAKEHQPEIMTLSLHKIHKYGCNLSYFMEIVEHEGPIATMKSVVGKWDE